MEVMSTMLIFVTINLFLEVNVSCVHSYSGFHYMSAQSSQMQPYSLVCNK